MRRLLLLVFPFWALFGFCQSSDTYIGACAGQPQCVLASNVQWSQGNQVWRFTAYQPSESIRIWILNHNPTSAHTSQIVQIFITDDPTAPSLLNNADRWVQAAVQDNTITGAQCVNINANSPTSNPGANGKATCYTVGMYTTQVAIRITGAASATGNPDTFDIGVVQQPTTYPGGPQPGSDSSTGGDAPTSLRPLVSSATESSHVFKAASGTLYSLYVTSTTAGLLMIFDLTTVPADGAVTPLHCIPIQANQEVSISFGVAPAETYVNGVTAALSTGSNCFNKTLITPAAGFFHAQVK